jgi:hypothetical protein
MQGRLYKKLFLKWVERKIEHEKSGRTRTKDQSRSNH